MDKKDILELFDYCDWARARLLESLKPMTQEDFEKDMHSSHGGVRGTLYHIVNAEKIWLRRLKGETHATLDESALKTLADFQTEWEYLDGQLRSYINGISEADLHGVYEYKTAKGDLLSQPRIWSFLQLVNHFSYHRGQIVTFQRQLGYKPVNTDMIGYFRETQN
ncbi:MAG TPA: DinB family protein [Candidatus Kryptonia bacterium]